jgi:hypothetical protein
MNREQNRTHASDIIYVRIHNKCVRVVYHLTGGPIYPLLSPFARRTGSRRRRDGLTKKTELKITTVYSRAQLYIYTKYTLFNDSYDDDEGFLI